MRHGDREAPLSSVLNDLERSGGDQAASIGAPALGVLALGLGLMACDGLLVLVGYALAAVTAYLLFVSL